MQTEMQTEIEIPEDQLTAYAMGEIAGVDREVVEAFLESDADACQQVQQIRATARLLAGELARETRSALLPVHRVTIEQHVYPLPPLPDLPPARSKRFWRIVTWALGLAACVAVVAGAGYAWNRWLDRSGEIAAARRLYADAVRQSDALGPTASRPASQPSQAGPPGMYAVFMPGYGPGAAAGGFAPYGVPAAYGAYPGAYPGTVPGPASPNWQWYYPVVENGFLPVWACPLSTFSADVDTASYSGVRRFLSQGALPPPEAVRIAEMVNYFPYRYAPPGPDEGAPFKAYIEVAGCPWNPAHRLARVALKAKEAGASEGGEGRAEPAIVARNVRVQVEFNPAVASAYRLIGYENPWLAGEDFNDDAKDAGGVAGEVVAGHAVTALYEFVPAGTGRGGRQAAEELKYKRRPVAETPPASYASGELLTVKLRYREPDGKGSRLLEFPVTDGGGPYAAAGDDFRFAAAVAAFGMILRDSPHKGTATFDGVIAMAQNALGADAGGYRAEFVDVVRKARALATGR